MWDSTLFSRVAAVLSHECCFICSHPVLDPEGHLSLKLVTLHGYLKTNTTRERTEKDTDPVLLLLITPGLMRAAFGVMWVLHPLISQLR